LTEQFLPARAALLKARRDWSIGFKGSKGTPSWINLGIANASGCIWASLISYVGSSAPTGKGYTKIYSTYYAFATLKADGSITAWGNLGYGGTDAPSDSGYTKIYSTDHATIEPSALRAAKAAPVE
jgi:hypothetical protein